MDSTADIIKRLQGYGLTQSEIHRRTGIPQPRLSRWAAGKTPDAADDALKLAKLDAELQQGAASSPATAPNIPGDRCGTESAEERVAQVSIAFGNRRVRPGTKADRDGAQEASHAA